MSPKLKTSCFLFWITWILSVSYMIAIYVFEDMFYLPVSEELNIVSMSVTLVCLITAVLASCGCALIFFDATNFACILLYIIPLALVVPCLTAFAISKVGRPELITNKSIEDFVIKDWKAQAGPPRYLAETQSHMGCCGLYGPVDYREFIYGNSCEMTSFDVPLSCCNVSSIFRSPSLDVVNKTCGNAVAGNNVNLYKCKGLFENIFSVDATLVNQMYSVNLNDAQLQMTTNLCKYANIRTAKIKDDYIDVVYSQGCLQFMVKSNELIVNWNYIFLISSSLVTSTLLLVFLKNWCGTAEVLELRPLRSNSHLSQETLILDGIKSRQMPLTKVAKGLMQ